MLAGGFEARCELPDGRRYIWSGSEGLCAYPWDAVVWLDKPDGLPEGDWYPTEPDEE